MEQCAPAIMATLLLLGSLVWFIRDQIKERTRQKEIAEAWEKIADHAYKYNLPLPGPWNNRER